jgi:hypothetical protein
MTKHFIEGIQLKVFSFLFGSYRLPHIRSSFTGSSQCLLDRIYKRPLDHRLLAAVVLLLARAYRHASRISRGTYDRQAILRYSLITGPRVAAIPTQGVRHRSLAYLRGAMPPIRQQTRRWRRREMVRFDAPRPVVEAH